MRRKQYSCCYCHRQLTAPTDRSSTALTFDHVVPESRGGRKTVPCCVTCNRLKGDLDPDLWRLVTTHHAKWWKTFRTHHEVRRAAWELARTYYRRNVG